MVGGQYGSEGKGVIVNKIANDYDVHVRTGGPNAGHSFYYNGQPRKMQAIPCGWTNPSAMLVIGRGALVNPEILNSELEWLEKEDPNIRSRLLIDYHAGVLDPSFHVEEGGIHGEIHERIGSTGEGVGAARMARMARNPKNFSLMADVAADWGLTNQLADTVSVLNGWVSKDKVNVLLEGTQGSGLSLIHGPWPFVTSSDTNAAQLAADAGIPPHWVSDVLLVVRAYPIRVAGNSGPLENELSWGEMSSRVGRPVQERTTVTKLIRRVGEWDDDLFKRSVMLNAPTDVALTFADYISPKDEGLTSWDAVSRETKDFVGKVETMTNGVKIRYVGTGGDGWKVIDRWVY